MNGYTNGYGSAADRYGYGNYRQRDQPSSQSGRGPGGYGGHGGFGAPDSLRSNSSSPAFNPGRPSNGERPRPGGRFGGGGGHFQAKTRGGKATQQMDEVLKYIQREWDFMTQDNCIPVQVASQLLDDTSLGLAHRSHEFHDTQERLHTALRAIVNEHHQGFNSSIGTFHQIQSNIQSSHERVLKLKEELLQAKQKLSTSKPEYANLISSSQNYARMLDELTAIEQLQQAPERLEASISEKRFLAAVDVLQDALKISRRPDLDNINALSETRIYISNQEHTLTDILIEELHNHLYLKSPYCEDRWQSYARTSGPEDSTSLAETRPLNQFLSKLYDDVKSPMSEDTSRNPEADSFHYIHVIAESLNKLGRLEEAVDAIEERLPVELFKVTERSNNEVIQRHPSVSVKASLQSLFNEDPALRKFHKLVLTDLLETLYGKFEAIAESHRVFHDAVVGIARREDGYGHQRISRGFKGLWQLYQSEIRSLLHDYLTTGEEAQSRNQASLAEANIFRHQRDRNKKCTFKLDAVELNSEKSKPIQDEMVSTWQKYVPGLASLTQGRNQPLLATNSNANTLSLDSTAAGHKLVVEPSVFNIGCLLPPSVRFLNRLKSIVPPSSDIIVSTLSSFLNDFLINVFHPQLEETLTDYCAQTVNQFDAFQQDPSWQEHSARPLFKGTVRFFKIVEAFCRMLDDLTHDQVFSQLLITQMNSYYDRCNHWFKGLITRTQTDSANGGRRLKAAASLGEVPDVVSALNKLRAAKESSEIEKLIESEPGLLLANVKDRPVLEADLISDRRTQSQICLLYSSMKWLSVKIASLRKISDRATNSSSRRDSTMSGSAQHRRLTHSLPERPAEDSEAVYLPLNEETAALFDGIVQGFQDLASMALRTLHLELRCHIIQKLLKLFSGDFAYTEQVDAPDDNVLDLVNGFLVAQQSIKSGLQDHEHLFITRGATELVDTILVNSLTNEIKSLNNTGAAFLQLNAGVLYHNLINIEENGDLSRTFRFLSLFESGSEAVSRAIGAGEKVLNKKELDACTRLLAANKKK